MDKKSENPSLMEAVSKELKSKFDLNKFKQLAEHPNKFFHAISEHSKKGFLFLI